MKSFPSLCPGDPAPGTVPGYGALAAAGISGKAHVLPEEDEDFVDFPPEVLREDLFKLPLGFLWSLCGHKAPAVRDTMDVGINADGWLPKGKAQDEVCRFSPHSWEGKEFLFRFGNFASMPLEEDTSDILKPFRLLPVEPHRVDEARQVLLGKGKKILRFPHHLVKALQNLVGCRVFRAVAQNSSKENVEGVTGDFPHRFVLPLLRLVV